MKRIISQVMLMFLFAGALVLALQVRPAGGDAQIVCINSDGSVSPIGAPISTADNITYTLTGNISYPVYFGIVVRRSNIVINGGGYTVLGNGTVAGVGVNVTSINNVTIRNTNINSFQNGIYLYSSSSCTISGNNVTANAGKASLAIYSSNNNVVSGNNATSNGDAVAVILSMNNTVSNNKVANNNNGIFVSGSSNNTVSGNNATGGTYMMVSFLLIRTTTLLPVIMRLQTRDTVSTSTPLQTTRLPETLQQTTITVSV